LRMPTIWRLYQDEGPEAFLSHHQLLALCKNKRMERFFLM
jgi:hypothetical protein